MNREAQRRDRLARRRAAAGPTPHLRAAMGGAPLVNDWTRPADDPREHRALLDYLMNESPALHAEKADLLAARDALMAMGDMATPELWQRWDDWRAAYSARIAGAKLRIGVRE